VRFTWIPRRTEGDPSTGDPSCSRVCVPTFTSTSSWTAACIAVYHRQVFESVDPGSGPESDAEEQSLEPTVS
jgi:hypothetical protein